MLARVHSSALWGVDAVPVLIEVQILSALRRFSIVGLPDGVVREAKERVRCAIENSGHQFPASEVIVSLAPADLPKAGSAFDFAIAAGILAALGFVSKDLLEKNILLGELALDGTIKPVRGALAASCLALEMGFGLLLAEENVDEAKLVEVVEVTGVSSLADLSLERGSPSREISGLGTSPGHGGAVENLKQRKSRRSPSFEKPHGRTFSDVVGQHAPKRALEIAAAGCHNVLMMGPPGSGKSMLAERVASILPPFSLSEQIEVLKVHSADLSQDPERRGTLPRERPFRAPHHTVTPIGLIGGGGFPTPGEVSLAHRGVLFLDELPHLRRDALEALREPLETQMVTISRSRQRLNFPADFLFIAAMNPCPCGRRGLGNGLCNCLPTQIARYVEKISGPIMDRIDLQIWVPTVSLLDMATERIDDPTEMMKERVLRAREIQKARVFGMVRTNSRLGPNEMRKFCELPKGALGLLQEASKKFSLSARAYSRVLKVARTIADLAGSAGIREEHLSEALSYRMGTTP